MSQNFNSMKAMLASAIPPLLHREERRPAYADADLRLHVQGESIMLIRIDYVAILTRTHFDQVHQS
jgi:hypothetical protein